MKRWRAMLVYSLVYSILSLSLTGCGRKSEPEVVSGPVSIYSDEAVVITADLARQMKSAAPGAGVNEVQANLNRHTEDELYNPNARIAVDLIAQGAYTPADLLAEARKREGTPYSACLVMSGLANAINATDPERAKADFLSQQGQLLDYLAGRKIPTVVCEVLPVISDYQKKSYKRPASEINTLIDEMNRDLYGLALNKAAGFVFTQKVFAGRVGPGKHSLLLNKENAGVENGIQPTVEGIRLLAQLYAHGLHAAGYRDGRVLLLGDSVMADEALTRAVDKMPFLLTKQLEIELHKSCP